MQLWVWLPLPVAAVAGSAQAETKKNQPVVLRSAAGTVIQPTRTIMHNGHGPDPLARFDASAL